MTRWTYIIPRLMMVALIALAAWLGNDVIIKRMIVHSMENVIGAKVEVAQVRTNWDTGKVLMKDLRMADPRNPMNNLFQAEMAHIEFDMPKLWKREFIIKGGKATNIQFGAPRTESGFLRPVMNRNKSEAALVQSGFSRNDLEKNWLDSLENTSSDIQPLQLKAEALARKIDNAWSQEMANINLQLAELKRLRENTSSQIDKQGIQVLPNNPLRNDDSKLLKTNQTVVEIKNRISNLMATYTRMERKKNSDLQRLISQTKQDAATITNTRKTTHFDGEKITKLLLTDVEHKTVVEVIDWFRWFRANIPSPETDFAPAKPRGENIQFSGSHVANFLVESLDFEGGGRFAGRHVDFFGTVNNLTAAPKFSDKPCVFDMRAQGDQPVVIHCELDHRNEKTWRDRLTVSCSELPSPLRRRRLGTDETLLVSIVGNPKLIASVDVTTQGEKIQGSITLQHVGLRLHVEKLNALAGGESAVLRLNQTAIPTITELKTRITLSGTLDAPSYQITSDIGQQFANALQEVSEFQAREQFTLAVSNINKKNQLLATSLQKKLTQYVADIRDGLRSEEKSYFRLDQRMTKLKKEEDPFRRR